MQKRDAETQMPAIFEVTEWPEHSLGRFVQGMQIVADCSSLGNGWGQKMVKGDESSWYVCLPCVGKAVCIREDLIKPEGKSWMESCQTCGRRIQN